MPENYITCQDEKGSINISEDVVAAMVRAAITEVDGVAGIATSAGTELAELLGTKSARQGTRCDRRRHDDGRHDHHGALWLQRCGRCQSGAESVTSAVESMTGIGKPIVNVHVSGVAFDK